jgi:type 1 fimbria pilin
MHTGVAIVIHNKLKNHIYMVNPNSDRIMYLTLNATIPLTFIATYCPTAHSPNKDKNIFYKRLEKV